MCAVMAASSVPGLEAPAEAQHAREQEGQPEQAGRHVAQAAHDRPHREVEDEQDEGGEEEHGVHALACPQLHPHVLPGHRPGAPGGLRHSGHHRSAPSARGALRVPTMDHGPWTITTTLRFSWSMVTPQAF
jgi:hypothetical protein